MKLTIKILLPMALMGIQEKYPFHILITSPLMTAHRKKYRPGETSG